MIGLGSDLIDIRRIENTLSKFGDRFKKRIFTENEIKNVKEEKKVQLVMLKGLQLRKLRQRLLVQVLEMEYFGEI